MGVQGQAASIPRVLSPRRITIIPWANSWMVRGQQDRGNSQNKNFCIYHSPERVEEAKRIKMMPGVGFVQGEGEA